MGYALHETHYFGAGQGMTPSRVLAEPDEF